MSSLPALKRGIRFRDLALFYVVISLGVRWTATAAAAGPSILVVWIVGLICFFVPLAATVMELSERHPEEGGLYVWSRAAFGDFAGFIAAWTYWMSNLPLFAGLFYFGAASVLYAFGPRAQVLGASPFYFISFSVLFLTLITLLNIRSADAGKWLNNIGSLASILPITAVMSLAVVSWFRFGPANSFTTASLVPHFSLGNAVFWSTICLAFTGIEAGSSMGDEIQNPRRTIPWAILVGGTILTIGYIGGTAALLVALPARSSAAQKASSTESASSGACRRPWLLVPIALLVGLNSIGGAAANFTANSRLPFVVGIHHYLPTPFGWIHPRYRTPWVAITVLGVMGIGVSILSQAGTSVRGAYDVLVSMTVLSTLAALPLYLRRPHPPAESRSPRRRAPRSRRQARRHRTGLPRPCQHADHLALFLVPSADETNKPLAVAKVVGGMIVLVGAGVVVFIGARVKARRDLKTAAVA